VASSDLDRVTNGLLVVNVGDHVARAATGIVDQLDRLLQRGCGSSHDGYLIAFLLPAQMRRRPRFRFRHQ